MLTDDQIASRLAEGSPSGIEALYDRYGAIAFAVASRVLNDAALAEDVVQDAFLSIWRRSSAFDAGRGSLRTWVCTIVRNRAIDRTRGPQGRARYVLPLETATDEPGVADTWAGVLEELTRQEIQAALTELPAEQRETIEMAYFSGYSQAEISEAMNVPLGTVKGRSRLGLSRLRQVLTSRGAEWTTQ